MTVLMSRLNIINQANNPDDDDERKYLKLKNEF